MAIFRLSSKGISRGSGGSAIASAAYRAGECLKNEVTGKEHDYTKKTDVSHTEIMLPEKADPKFKDRQTLWNAVEQKEKRVNSEFAKEYQLAIPVELDKKDMIALVKDFSQTQFVDKGLAVDVAFHKLDKDNPHAHIMTTTRSFDDNGELGKKERFYRDKSYLVNLRKDWELSVNKLLVEKGIDQQITAESYESRGIDLKGINSNFKGEYGKEDIAKQRFARSMALLEKPSVIPDILTDKNAKFTTKQLGAFLDKNVVAEHRPHLVEALAQDTNFITLDDTKGVYTSASYLLSEKSLVETIGKLNKADPSKQVSEKYVEQVADKMKLSEQQKGALDYAVSTDSNVKNIEGYAGTGKSYTIQAIKEVYEQAGFETKGVALSGIVADNLGKDAKIEDSRTVASFLYRVENDMTKVTDKTVLFVDESSLIGVKDYDKLTGIIEKAGGKLINVGDDNQLQSIQAGDASRLVKENTSHYTLSEVRRQENIGDKQASLDLSTGKQREALTHYLNKGAIEAHGNKNQLMASVVNHYGQALDDNKTSIVMAHKKVDVAEINKTVHDVMREAGNLPKGVEIDGKEYSKGDRFIFLQNDNGLGVKNGTTGTIEQITKQGELQIKTDDKKTINFNAQDYKEFDHAYAVTIHKAQGVTVDRAQLYLDKGADSHLTLVGATRHKESLTIHVTDQTKDNPAGFSSFDDIVKTCERSRVKENVGELDQDLLSSLNNNPAVNTEYKEKIQEILAGDVKNYQHTTAEVAAMRQDSKQIGQEISSTRQNLVEQMQKDSAQEKANERQQERGNERTLDRGGYGMSF